MYKDKVVLCGASAYEQKYYFNDDFASLPQSIQDELHIMCVLYTEEIGGVLTLEFDEDGSLQFQVEALEADAMFDEIGSVLRIKDLRQKKKELLESLELYYKVFFLGQEVEDEKPPLSPEKKKKRRNIAILITFLLLLCLGIGIALGMKRMKDLDRQEKEYYEKLHKEVVHQDTPSEEIEKEVDETEKQDAAQEETTKQERFQLVNPDEIDFSQYQKIVPVSTEQNSIKESDTYDYSAQSAVDGDSSTSWQENEENTGETTGIRINFDGNHKVRYLVLYLGNWRSDQLWEYSARPKTLTIQVGDSETKDIEFSDEKKKFCLSFEEPIDASYISMYIADSYEGSRWNDNGISEVEIYE